MTEEILRVEHISKRFGGVIALDDVSFSLQTGQVWCLVGENGSGKSTMIKAISGVYAPDAGDIYVNGHHYSKLTPLESIHEGIQVIYQDFSLFPNLSVAENIAMNQLLAAGKQLISWKEIHQIAKEGLEKINISLPLNAIVDTLSTADRQLIAITKALLADARIIVMDEPTTALTSKEVNALFRLIRELRSRGISILFVSHKLNEIAEIADHILVFRNGKKVLDQDAQRLEIQTMEYYMTGRKLEAEPEPVPNIDKTSTPLLQVQNLTRAHSFFDISFDLYGGEIVGVTGLLGSGRTELALSLFGELPADSGKIWIAGRERRIGSVPDAMRYGIGYVPEDRVREGLFLPQSITNNVVISSVDRLMSSLSHRRLEQEAGQWINRLEVKANSGNAPVANLSGGNQQRVVLAKWLATHPKILILNGPTVGVDVGSKAEIHALIQGLAQQGMGILLISDDVPELLRICHRIFLMRAGRFVREFKQQELSEEILNTELVGASVTES